jgi:gliding motility-associated protein GldL
MHGKKWKNFMAKLYGFGASIVIIGAMFKIQHWPGAGPMLVLGLSTEALIFFFSAFEKPHEDPDWSLVYPELAGLPDGEGGGVLAATQELDNLLEDANIGPELLESLGSGLNKLSDSTNKLGDITDASVATNEYVENMRSASTNVGELSQAYMKASSSIGSMVVSEEDGASVRNEMRKMGENLTQLNSQYHTQLEGTRAFLENSQSVHGGMTELMGTLNDSVSDAQKYKEEVAQLANNISSLNRVYGNMLSAMNAANQG